MNDEIKEILEYFKVGIDKLCISKPDFSISYNDVKILLDYITNLQQENERLKEQNNDLRKIYKHTYNWLFENGNDELARYFQAQINECPTFYVEPTIDYHKEWKDYKARIEKAVEYIENHQLVFELSSLVQIKEWFDMFYKDTLNILNGRSDE